MHVLVFPGWYPSRIDELSGDFIQRHMVALSHQCKVSVVIGIKDNNVLKSERITLINGNLTEYYFYYPSGNGIKAIEHFIGLL